MPWYSDWFGKDYLEVYAHRSDALAESEVDFIVHVLGLERAQLLVDIACGAGRHVRLLSSRGSRAVGADLSLELLLEARRLSLEVNQTVQYLRHDMRRLPFADASIDAILSIFTSFGYFETDAEHLGVLSEVHRVLRAGGSFLLDYLNAEHVLANLEPKSQRIEGNLHITELRSYDQQSKRIEKTIVLEEEGRVREYHESVRVYRFAELRLMLKDSGLEIQDSFGSFSGASLNRDSARAIILAAKLDS